MKKLGLLLFTLCSVFYISAQETITIQAKLNWAASPVSIATADLSPLVRWQFDNAIYSEQHPSLPYFQKRFPLRTDGSLNVSIVNIQYEPFTKKTTEDDNVLGENIHFFTETEQDQLSYYGKIGFIPIRKVGSSYERVVSFELVVSLKPTPPRASPRDPRSPLTSNLSEGQLRKIAVSESGIYRMDYNYLKDQLSIDIDNIDPRQLKVLGNGGGMLPDANNLPRYEDVEEYAIYVSGESDGSFDPGDFILFYAQGPHKWIYNTSTKAFERQTNIYDFENHYFVKISPENGKRIQQNATIANTAFQTTTFTDYQSFEEDKFNLLNDYSGTQGSGVLWFGDRFNPTKDRTYSNFNFPNIDTNTPASLRLKLAGRGPSSSSLRVSVGTETYTRSISRVDISDSEGTYARIATVYESFIPQNEQVSVKVNYPLGGSDSEGWLDFIEVNASRRLIMTGNSMSFRSPTTADFPTSSFSISNATDKLQVWDVTEPILTVEQEYTINGNTLTFGDNTGSLREYIILDPSADFPSPEAVGEVANQNLHGIQDVDMLIVYHSEFEDAAKRLADHRRNHGNLNVAIADIDQIYNEFSGGSVDPTAIRDLAKIIYDRDPSKFRYLLLFGDGSFDFRDIYNRGTTFIPPYEYEKSVLLNPIEAFPSDDYFALLSENEGGDLEGALDIAVGRLPVKTAQEAAVVVDKIIRYEASDKTLGDWRNRMVFLADDEDGNIHVDDADGIAVNVQDSSRQYNVNKIYFDAFRQESTPGGARFPGATAALDRDIFRGVLIVNYLGHGGSKGWAQERVLRPEDIDGWRNENQLPLFITATCSFTGFDDPGQVTAGEQCLLKPDGGAIGLLTTVRAVYASSNARLTRAVFDKILASDGANVFPIGEIMRQAKNSVSSSTRLNSRKFFTIADPAMFLAIPTYNVATTKINGQTVNSGLTDTLSALEKVTIEGIVTDNNGQLMSDFNGTVYPTIYDKYITINTLVQDVGFRGSLPKAFKLQKNLIFKGAASVVNGQFSFTFIVPKDINYNFGNGKISYYANDNRGRDANGFYEGIIIGGADPNAANDDQPPLVEVFMDDENFAFGGITDEDPTLFVKLADDNGINVAGNSIGHDLTGVLDENTQSTYVLNDFYESALDDYTQGSVRFPLYDLEEGRHTIKVKAWDIANNPAEGYTEFVVANSAQAALDLVLNYPNPFTTNTQFQFGHNLSGRLLDIQVQIFTISGRMVKTIEVQRFAEGSRISDIAWMAGMNMEIDSEKGFIFIKLR